ncbi:MAG: 2-C-methyl-D-erythritol 4-phosphate cytidylyltransferase [Planctomycetes bacterium]|nr:2-C-methyl-D-erythritol 4-phosphate cytidylyltransferase [Planctomycetota bacterium]
MQADTTMVVVAAGQGRRMGDKNKALLALGDEPVLAHVLRSLTAASCCREIIVVMNEDDHEALAEQFQTSAEALGATHCVPGGAERWLSSRQGCEASSPDSSLVLVHDAARALIRPETIDAVARAAREQGAALAAAPLADTLKREGSGGQVAETLPRQGLWRAQTPQGARRDWLLAAFAAWDTTMQGLPTDEAMLLEHAGHHPTLVPAPTSNFKLTTPDDLALAQAWMAAR